MSNRCRRCNRKLLNAEALYGWRCAEILGIAETATKLPYKDFVKLTDSVNTVDDLFKGSNLKLNDTQMNAMYIEAIKALLFENKNTLDEAMPEMMKIILMDTLRWYSLKAKVKEFPQKFKEYVDAIKKDGFIDGTSKTLAKEEKLGDVSATGLELLYEYSVQEPAVLDKNGNLIENSANKQGVENYKHNSEIDMSEYKEYINGQDLGSVAEFKFGNTTMDKNGCEIIATYNALVTLGAKEDLCKIAAHYESDGQMLNGTWGTNPYAVERYFKQRGYEVSRVEGDNILNNKIPDADAYIFSFWNSDKVSGALHTVAVRKTEIGKYVFYNHRDDKKNQKNTDGFKDYIEEKDVQPIIIFAINKKK